MPDSPSRFRLLPVTDCVPRIGSTGSAGSFGCADRIGRADGSWVPPPSGMLLLPRPASCSVFLTGVSATFY
jgi:hypothetical protein